MHLKMKLPIKTVSEANKTGEHWTKKSKRHKAQKALTHLFLASHLDETCLPCTITLTRIAPRELDRWENLPMSFKFILDAIAELLIPNKAIGQADSDKRMSFKYEQKKGNPKEYAIEVEIHPR